MTGKKESTGNLARDFGVIAGVLALVTIVYSGCFHAPAGDSHDQHRETTEAPSQGPMGAGLELPDNYPELVALGNQTMDEGRFAEAAECYRRALDLDGSSPDVRTDFGACLHAMGLPERAIEEFRTVLSSLPGHRIANFNAGIVQRELGQPDSARFYWERTLALDPESPMAPRLKELLQGLDGSY